MVSFNYFYLGNYKKLSQIYLKNPAINFISSQTPIDQVVSEMFKCKSLHMTDAKWRQYLTRVDDDHAHQIMTFHTTLCVHHYLKEQMSQMKRYSSWFTSLNVFWMVVHWKCCHQWQDSHWTWNINKRLCTVYVYIFKKYMLIYK